MASRKRKRQHAMTPTDASPAHPSGAPTEPGRVSAQSRLWQRHGGWLAALVTAAALVAIPWLHPFHDVFEFDPDEGNNMMLARAISAGYELYSEVWLDQPPLFNYLSVVWGWLFGSDVNSIRALVVLFTASIVFAVYDSLRLSWGHAAALAGVLLLPLTRSFLRLSTSVMAGLPCIALALLCAWAMLRWSRSRHVGWLVAAGAFMACSLATKLFTGFLLPLFGLWILLVALHQRRGQPGRWKALLPPAIWSVCVIVLTAGLLLWMVPPGEWHQLYKAHSAAADTDMASYTARNLMRGIRADWEVAVLAGIGLAQIMLCGRWSLVLIPAWCVAAYVALSFHSPVWYHHHLLLSVPGCLVAGVAIGDVFRRDWWPPRGWRHWPRVGLRVAAVVVTVLLVVALARGQKRQAGPNRQYSGPHNWFAVALMQEYAEQTDVVATDRQMYAVRAGYLVPPNLCLTSQKRVRTNNLSIEEVIETIAAADPEQIVFARTLYRHYPRIMRSFRDRYRLVYERQGAVRVYVRNDLVADPLTAVIRAAQKMPYAGAYDYIGIEWCQQGELEKARAALQRANELDPTAPGACRHLAELLMSQGDYVRGFDVLAAGTRTRNRADYMANCRAYAWRRATCPQAGQRNGAQAEDIARRVLALAPRPAPEDLQVLAAALAAKGEFDQATTVATRALETARSSGQNLMVRRLQQQLQKYRRGEPWIEEPAIPLAHY